MSPLQTSNPPRELTVAILGTGTGVGKTYFTSALARAMASAHPDAIVAALKPIETGLDSGQVSDADTLTRASVHVQPPAQHPLFGFAPPVSPHLAARQTGSEIQSLAVSDWLRSYQSEVRR
ncbi:MAG TPA: dethiobiotin synthase, partial [Polyangiaceae bacterium]|nr:dethiobiotin synthase [Polyangiaceae bacterium]